MSSDSTEMWKMHCMLDFSRDWPVDSFFGMPLRQNLASCASHVSMENCAGMGDGGVCFEQGPVALHHVNLAQP